MECSSETQYEIEVKKDGTLLVWGWLNTQELIKIANFYMEQGYTEVLIGEENSSLHLRKDCSYSNI